MKYILHILLVILPFTAFSQEKVPADTKRADEETLSATAVSPADAIWFPVKKIVDGDTFWIDDGSPKGLKIRLTGIDSPEPRNTGTKTKSFFGAESTNYLKELLYNKRVRLEFDVSRYDRYGRTLAYVFLEDGTFVNAEMVRNGYATVMTVPPNVRHAGTFTELASGARKGNKGLWKGDPSLK